MKIAIVVHDFDLTNGQGRYCIELAKRLPEGWSLDVFANTFGVSKMKHWRFHRVFANRQNHLLTVFSFNRALKGVLESAQYDIVHAQGSVGSVANVITGHICLQARNSFQSPTGFKSRIFPILVTPLERKFYHRNKEAHLIGVSRSLIGDIRSYYGFDGSSTVVYHGVDGQRFGRPTIQTRIALRELLGIAEDVPVILFVGEAVKGVAMALRSLTHITDAVLVVVSRSTSSPYVRLARRLGVLERVIFTGFKKDVAPFYQMADVFLYPSPYDSFGMVILEAMSCGLPCILSKHIGVAEIIDDGVDGLLCQYDSIESIVGCLSRLLKNRAVARAVGDAAAHTAGFWTWDRCALGTFDVYRRVSERR